MRRKFLYKILLLSYYYFSEDVKYISFVCVIEINNDLNLALPNVRRRLIGKIRKHIFEL